VNSTLPAQEDLLRKSSENVWGTHIKELWLPMCMAYPIEATPILEGEDAERFLADLANPPNPEERKAMFKEAAKVAKQFRRRKD